MPNFEYKAIDPQKNKKIKSQMEANDEDEVFKSLSQSGLVLVDLKEAKKRKSRESSFIAAINRVSPKDLVVFSRQFSVMLKASVPVVKSLRILIKQTKNPKLQVVLGEVADDVEGGVKLSDALGAHEKVFGDFFIAMIKSGETSGRLDEVLEYLADQQEKDYDLMSKIKGAMIYPVFIVCGLIGVGIVMMIFVIPKLTDVLQETGGELPGSTKILIAVSGFLSNYWWLLIIILIGLFFGFKMATKTKSGKIYRDWAFLKMPVFGKLFQKIYLVRFSRSLSTLSSGGISLVESLKITADVVGNNVYRGIIEQTIEEVEEGNTIASVLIDHKEIPAMVAYMVDVGEQTGKLDLVLQKLSDFYTRQIDNMVANLVSLIEPLIMVVLGVAVGLMVAAIIMPMYNMASSL